MAYRRRRRKRTNYGTAIRMGNYRKGFPALRFRSSHPALRFKVGRY